MKQKIPIVFFYLLNELIMRKLVFNGCIMQHVINLFKSFRRVYTFTNTHSKQEEKPTTTPTEKKKTHFNKTFQI